MTNCWAILEILPTHDFDEISRARRTLIRKWHPDIVNDPAQKEEYTTRCATINAAYDQAVRIAEIRERVLRATAFQSLDAEAELRRSSYRRNGSYSEATFKIFSPGVAAVAFVYMLGFRFFLPATIFGILFGAGLVLAAVIDVILYRYAVRPLLSFLDLQNRPFIPWALLELVNILLLGLVFEDTHLLFHAGLILAVPLWRLRRWTKERRHKSETWGSVPSS